MKQTKRLAAALLALCLVVGILPVTVFGTEDGICSHHENHTPECGYAPAVAEVPCDLSCADTDEDGIVDHVEGCAYTPAQAETPCTYVCKVCAIQALIDDLPEEVTAENGEAVTQQIAAIDEAEAALSAEELALVDFTRYDATAAKLEALANSETPVCETHAAYVTEGVCRICGIQTLIDALPETVTEDNAAEVAQQLTVIDEAKTIMTAEELALVDFSRYNTTGTSLEEMKARITGNEVIVTTEDELIAAIDEANARAAALGEGETMEQMTIRLANDITLTKIITTEAGISVFLQIKDGANVYLTSVEGEQYTLKPDDMFHSTTKKLLIRMILVTGTLKLSDLIIDGNSAAPNFGTSAISIGYGRNGCQGVVTICDKTVITGYGKGATGPAIIAVYTGGTLIMEGGEICYNDTTGLNKRSDYIGGIICVSEATFIMNGGWIHHNTMQHSGSYTLGGSGIINAGIGIINPTKVTINGGVVEDNWYEGKGGAISGANAAFRGRLEITINGGIFRNNEALLGGAVSINGNNSKDSSTKLTINGGQFLDNTACGGAINVEGYVSFTMEDGIISGNKAVDPVEGDGNHGEGGGAIVLKNNCKGTINGGTITNNYSELSGGAIQVFNGSELTINDCEISGNVAEAHAGGICVDDKFTADEETYSVLTINGGRIVNNTSNSIWSDAEHQGDPYAPGGAGVYLHGNCRMYMNGGEISGNKALGYGSGGGVYVCFGGYFEMNDGYIEHNTAAKHGGGVYVDGTNSYEGHIHEDERVHDDTYGTGAVMVFNNGRIGYNTAMLNGGGLYISGQTVTMVDDGNGGTKEEVFRGGLVRMNGGIITANTAMDMGGGVYLEAGQQGDYSACFYMTDGIMYFNVAGENGNTSSGANDAGADLYAEGGSASNTCFTVTTADYVTAYVQNPDNIYVPEADRGVWFINWFDDYSDQDPVYGKGDPATWESGRNTGRYQTSKVMDRIVYTPSGDDRDYEALILDWSTELKVVKRDVGEIIKEDQTYYFTVTFEDIPESFDAESKFPIETSGSVAGDTIGKMESGHRQ